MFYHFLVYRPYSYHIAQSDTSGTVQDPEFGLIVPDELVITFTHGVTSATVAAAIASVQGTIITAMPEIDTWAIRIPGQNGTSSALDAAASTLSANSAISRIEPDRLAQLIQ